MSERIRYFPITAYAVIMGLTGLTIVFSKFYHLQWLPRFPFTALLFFTTALFFVISFLYGLKAIHHFENVQKDFTHRIRVNFFSAISISFLLLSIAYLGYWPMVALVLWWMGTLLHTALMFHTITFWIRDNFEIRAMNPAWFIPVVGNILVPVAGVDFMPAAFSFFYFAVGVFFWLVLFTIFVNRVIFHHQMPGKFMPTLFILLAPPAVGFIAYMRITQSWDIFAALLLFLTYFFVGLLLFLHKSFRGLPFFISWWAFTFPMMAVTLASAVAYQVTAVSLFKYAAWVIAVLAFCMVLLVSVRTVAGIANHRICVNED